MQVNANHSNVLKSCNGAMKGLKNLKAGLMIIVIIGVYLVFVLPAMIAGTLHVVFNVSIKMSLFLYVFIVSNANLRQTSVEPI